MFRIASPSDKSATGSQSPTNPERTFRSSNSSGKSALPWLDLRVPNSWKKTTASTLKTLKRSVGQPLAPRQRGHDASLKIENYHIRRATLIPESMSLDFHPVHSYDCDSYLLGYNKSSSGQSVDSGYSSMSVMTCSESDDDEDSEDEEIGVSHCDILPHTEVVFIRDQYKKLSDSLLTYKNTETSELMGPVLYKTASPITTAKDAEYSWPTSTHISTLTKENLDLEEELSLAKPPASVNSSKTKIKTDESSSLTTPYQANDELFLSFFDHVRREPPTWLKRKEPITLVDHILHFTLNMTRCILFLPVCVSLVPATLLFGPAIEQLAVVHRIRGSDWSVMRDITKFFGICFFTSILALYLVVF